MKTVTKWLRAAFLVEKLKGVGNKVNVVEQKVWDLATPVAKDLGLTLVRAKYGANILQIMVEQEDYETPTVSQCTKLSRELSTLLDVEDFIADNYRLEVSSPGINRPLVSQQDFIRFKGKTIKVRTAGAVGDTNKFKGLLTGIENDEILLENEEGEHRIPFDMMQDAKVVPTDEDYKQILKNS